MRYRDPKRWTLRRLKQQYLWREEVRSDLTRVMSRIRAWHLVLADRFVERGWIDRRDDYFLLEMDEGGTDRSARDLEALDQGELGHALAGLHVTAQHQLAQLEQRGHGLR